MSMKRVFSLILAVLLFTSCSQTSNHRGKWSDELEVLMKQVNAEHHAVQKPELVNYEYLISTPIGERVTAKTVQANEDGSFSYAQAEADVNYLFDCLKNEYGLYDYYGGDVVFTAAKEEVLTACKSTKTLNAGILKQILWQKFSFVNDCHFFIGETSAPMASMPTAYTMSKMHCTFFSEERTFVKTKDGFKDENNRLVKVVEGFENVADAIKLSLTKDGELVYRLVVQGNMFDRNIKLVKKRDITVIYSDGSKDVLTAQRYIMMHDNGSKLELKWSEKIPVLTVKDFKSGMMKPYAEEMKNSDAVVLNLQNNAGGYMATTTAWYEEFCGEAVATNNLMIYRNYLKALSEVPGYQKLNNEAAVIWNTEDKFAVNDRLVILIVNNNTGSAGELFTDMAFNLENTLIVGESTMGCLTSGTSYLRTLPNSKLTLSYGNSIHLWPESHFKEGEGIKPDIWCPYLYAEEAVLNFIKKNIQ